MKVLVACEFSGVVREAFAKRGHDAWSCDILPSEDGSRFHIQDDIRKVLKTAPMQWDLMIAHPPCTYLCNSGVCWLKDNEERYEKLQEAAEFFRFLMHQHWIPKIAIENPIMHKYAKQFIGGIEQTQIIQPWQFGHGETKATCLWLKYLPPLKPTKIVEGREQRLHKLPPSPDRGKLRSITYQGIAEAMARQWG
jgi:hypothetical protein